VEFAALMCSTWRVDRIAPAKAALRGVT